MVKRAHSYSVSGDGSDSTDEPPLGAHHPQPVIIYELLRDMEYWITASFVFSVVLAVDHSWALRFKVFSKCGFIHLFI